MPYCRTVAQHKWASFFSQELSEDVAEEDQELLPGGDPDAGIPVDQARIHGIERGPHITTDNVVVGPQSSEHSSYPPEGPPDPAADILPVDVETYGNTSTDLTMVTQPPDSD